MSEDHGWNHPQCPHCWLRQWGLERTPVRVKDPDAEDCCFCGAETRAGIYVRVKPGSPGIPYCSAYGGFIYGEPSPPRTSPPSTDRPVAP